jgi:hypothetical protein
MRPDRKIGFSGNADEFRLRVALGIDGDRRRISDFFGDVKEEKRRMN